MLIPLDYYRILGVPPEATDEQLLQAWQDRRLQLPRWEYSELAIQSRLHLLEQAYQFLCNALSRDRYQQAFFQDPNLQDPNLQNPNSLTIGGSEQSSEENLENSQQPALADNAQGEEPTPGTNLAERRSQIPPLPELDIPPAQWGGALLILQELGEYEEIIKQAEAMIQSEPAASEWAVIPPASEESPATSPIIDIYLTLALAYLELSREQWQNNQYEQAAQSELRGLAWLEQQNLLPGVQAEIRAELNKLRPYRILELLSSHPEPSRDRQQGLALLQEILQQRQGIDGTGDDGSGLDADNFLRFIQQIRIYLTVAEQKKLFEAETHRPSAAANYLTAYAFIAQGFSQKQPEQIYQAFQLFGALQLRQDIYLEKAICALLLGQTEVAIASLQQHQDLTPLRWIQDYSEDDPDWLRGLCIYGEKWLQSEVFSRFWDLAQKKPSLQEYFADPSVQTYLDQNTLQLDIFPSPLSPEQTMAIPQAAFSPRYSTQKQRQGSSRRRQFREPQSIDSRSAGQATTLTATEATRNLSRSTTTLTNGNGYSQSGDQSLLSDPHPLSATGSATLPATGQMALSPQRKSASAVRAYHQSVAPKGRRKRTLKVGRIVLLATVLVACIGGVGLAVKALLDGQSPLSQLQSDQLYVPLNQSVIDIPPADALLSSPESVTPEFAQQLIQTWLASKSEAFGSQYQGDRMATVLSEPLLSVWKKRGENLAQSKAYWQYQHGLEADSVQVKSLSPTQATIDAVVREKATYFQGGKERANRSYDDTLRVRYGLVRQGDHWLIQSIQVLP